MSRGFRPLVSLRPALPATGLPILTPAGLPPAEHISLSWTHNRAGGFPAPGSPARFTPRVMGPTATAALSAATNPRLLHLARPDQPSPERISPVSGLADSGCFSQGTPASRVDEGITSSRAPSLRGHYPASSLLRTHPPPSRRQPTSRCCRLYGLPSFRPFGSARGGLLQLLEGSWFSCRR